MKVSTVKKDPIIIAHRGLREYAPENTLPAFAAAVELGLSFELDIYQTSDEGLIVIHDETVDRTTNGTGKVTEMSLADIRDLDAGRWFSQSFYGLGVPSLAEVFEMIIERQRTSINILLDVKTISPGIEQKIVATAEKYNVSSQIIVLRQTTDSSRRFKEANTDIKISSRVPGWSYDKEQFDKLLNDPLTDCLWTVDFVPSSNEIDRAHRLGKQVLLALNKDLPENVGIDRPDTEAEWDKALLNKMDGIMTDYPLECLSRWRMTRCQ